MREQERERERKTHRSGPILSESNLPLSLLEVASSEELTELRAFFDGEVHVGRGESEVGRELDRERTKPGESILLRSLSPGVLEVGVDDMRGCLESLGVEGSSNSQRNEEMETRKARSGLGSKLTPSAVPIS